jgi:hypothetical protein
MTYETATGDTVPRQAGDGVNGAVPTLNVDMSLHRPHRPASAAAGGGGGGGGGVLTAAAAVPPTIAAIGFGPGGGGSAGSASSGRTGIDTTITATATATTAGPFDPTGSAGAPDLNLAEGGIVAVGVGGSGGEVPGGGMTIMMTGGSVEANAPVHTIGHDDMVGGGGEGGRDTAFAAVAETATDPGSGGDGARARAPTATATASGVVAIPGPSVVEAALQDVAALTRGLEHALEDVRMMTVENAILLDSLALVGADV